MSYYQHLDKQLDHANDWKKLKEILIDLINDKWTSYEENLAYIFILNKMEELEK